MMEFLEFTLMIFFPEKLSMLVDYCGLETGFWKFQMLIFRTETLKLQSEPYRFENCEIAINGNDVGQNNLYAYHYEASKSQI